MPGKGTTRIMRNTKDFHYRMPGRIGGQRPGAHRSTTAGSGQEFIAHLNLFDRPDPRRLDLRASLRDPEQRWLVRVTRQRAGVPVYLLADVSTSMRFGSGASKLERVAEFARSLGDSTFRTGDSLGLLAFDSRERTDLMLAWEQPRYDVKLNVLNVFNKRYYEALYENGGFAVPGTERAFQLTATVRF